MAGWLTKRVGSLQCADHARQPRITKRIRAIEPTIAGEMYV